MLHRWCKFLQPMGAIKNHFLVFFDWIQEVFMEGLLRSTSCDILIGTMKQSTPFNAIAASVYPVEGSKLGHLDNTLPSKEVLELWSNADAVALMSIALSA